MSPYLFLALRLLIGIALYAFVILTLATLWRDIHSGFRRGTNDEIRVIHLRFEDRHPAEEHSFAIPLVTIGRDPACELVLLSESVSDRHATLRYHRRQWWIADLDSTSGTYLNRLAITTPTVIMDGDRLRCGDINFRISFERESDPSISPKDESLPS